MDKVLVHQKQVLNEQGEAFVLQYWLVSRVILNESDNEETAYGVEITKLQNGCCLEKEGAYCLSCCKQSIDRWIDALAEGDATPITLLALADDFISYGNIAG